MAETTRSILEFPAFAIQWPAGFTRYEDATADKPHRPDDDFYFSPTDEHTKDRCLLLQLAL